MAETINALINGALAKYSANLALRERRKGIWCDVSYAELAACVTELGTGMIFLGLQPGEKVGLFICYGSRWLSASLAILGAGGVDVPRGSDLHFDELAFIASHAEMSGMITDLPAETAARLVERVPGVRFAIVVGEEGSATSPIYGWEALKRLGEERLRAGDISFAGRSAAVREDDLATIVYTSGTSGRPKGVMLTHRNIASNISSILDALHVHSGERFLSILPPNHMFERTIEYLTLASGASLTFTDRNNFKNDLAAQSPNIIAGVPRLWEMLYQGISDRLRKHPFAWLLRPLLLASAAWMSGRRQLNGTAYRAGPRRQSPTPASFLRCLFLYPLHRLADFLVYRHVRRNMGGRLRFIVSGGGSLPVQLDDFFEMAGITLLNGYGLTETSPVLAMRRLEKNVKGTVGMPLRDTEIRIPDEEGKPVPPGVSGIIWVRGPQVMQGYYRDSEATGSVIRGEWFNTGDLGILTEEGDLAIVGRAKDTIVLFGGENVEPEPIETALVHSPCISQVMVVGQDQKCLAALVVPDLRAVREQLGDAVSSVVSNVELAEHPLVLALIRGEISRLHNRAPGTRPYEIITRFRLIPEEWSPSNGMLTFTLKKKRNLITEHHQPEIRDLYR